MVKINEDGTVTLSRTTYDSLVKTRKELRTLQAYGVDNWEGYSEAMSELYGDDDDEGDEDQ